MDKFDAVVIGDANIDLIVEGCRKIPGQGQEVFVDNMMIHVGGGAALFAISLAKLGLRTAFNGIVGDDRFGAFIRERFAEYGIDTRMLDTSEIHRTSISIALNPETDRSFISYAGSNQELSVERLRLDDIAQARHAHITGYKGRSNHEQYMRLVQSLKEKGMSISLDVGWDDSGEWDKGVFELMKWIDVFFLNETEAAHYTGIDDIEQCLRWMGEYGELVVVKLGAKGAAVIQNGVITRRSGYKVTAVDTTGAGDSFNAGYLYGYLTGKDADECLKYGNAAGALSVSAVGGSTGTRDFNGMMAFIREQEAAEGSDSMSQSQGT